MASSAASSSSAAAPATQSKGSPAMQHHVTDVIAKWTSVPCLPPDQLTRSAAKLAQTRAVGVQFLRLVLSAMPQMLAQVFSAARAQRQAGVSPVGLQNASPQKADLVSLIMLVQSMDRAHDDRSESGLRIGRRGFLLSNLCKPLETLLRACWLSVPVADALPILQELYPPLLQLLADAVEADCAQPVARFTNMSYTKEAWGAESLDALQLLSSVIEVTCSATWTPPPSGSIGASLAGNALVAASASSAAAAAIVAPPSADRLARAEVGWQALRPHVTEVLQLSSTFLTSKSPARWGKYGMIAGEIATRACVQLLQVLFRLPAMHCWLREEASVRDSLAAQTVQSFAMQMLLWMEDEQLVYPGVVQVYEEQQAYLSRGLPLPPQWPGGPRPAIVPDPFRDGNAEGWKHGAPLLDALLSASTDAEVHSDALSTLVWTHCSRTLQRAAAASSADPSQPAVSDLELRASMRGIESLLTCRPHSLSADDAAAVDQWLKRALARQFAKQRPLSKAEAVRLQEIMAEQRRSRAASSHGLRSRGKTASVAH